MSQKLNSATAVIGIDIGKNSFHVVGSARRHRATAEVVARPVEHLKQAPSDGPHAMVRLLARPSYWTLACPGGLMPH